MTDNLLFLSVGDLFLDFGGPYAQTLPDGWWTATYQPAWVVSLLPTNAPQYMLAHELVDADLAARDPIGLIAAARSDYDAPLPLLPYLALERSVDEFSGSWPEQRQRIVVEGSFAYHQVKGTRAALLKGIEPLGYRVTVVEWFEPANDRPVNTFRLRVDIDQDQPWTAADRSALIRQANSAKNAHTKLEAIEPVRMAGPAAVFVGGVPTRRRRLIVGTPRPDRIVVTGHSFIGAVSIRRRTIIVHST